MLDILYVISFFENNSQRRKYLKESNAENVNDIMDKFQIIKNVIVHFNYKNTPDIRKYLKSKYINATDMYILFQQFYQNCLRRSIKYLNAMLINYGLYSSFEFVMKKIYKYGVACRKSLHTSDNPMFQNDPLGGIWFKYCKTLNIFEYNIVMCLLDQHFNKNC